MCKKIFLKVLLYKFIVNYWRHSESMKIDKSVLSKEKFRRFQNSSERLKTHFAVTRIIDQFGRKRCQKKRKYVDHKLLNEFFQKNILSYMNDRLSKNSSEHAYVIPRTVFFLDWICKFAKILLNIFAAQQRRVSVGFFKIYRFWLTWMNSTKHTCYFILI